MSPDVQTILRQLRRFVFIPGPPDRRLAGVGGDGVPKFSGPAALIACIALAVYGFGPAVREFFELVPARLTAPFDLEWMEGLMLVGARKLWQSGFLYSEPSFEYVPVIYPPMHFILLGIVVPFAPATQYVLGRVLSLIFLAITQVLLYRIFAPRYGRAAGVFMALIPLSYFPVSGFWLDLIRLDNLYIMFLFATIAVQVSRVGDRAKLVLTAAFYLAALFSKQSSIVLLPAFILYWVYRLRFAQALAQFVLIAGSFAVLFAYWQWNSEGRFWKFMWEIGASHGYFFGSFELALRAAVDQQWFAMQYLKRLVWLVPAGLVVAVVIGVRRILWWSRLRGAAKTPFIHPLQRIDLYLFTFACGMLVMAYLLATHVGSYWNNNLPALYGYSILAYLAARNLVYPAFWWARKNGYRLRVLAWLPLVALVWVSRAHYTTALRAHVPDPHVTPEMLRERQVFAALIREHGPVFFPAQPPETILGSSARPHYHFISLDDLRTGPYDLNARKFATPENLAPFRFLLSWNDEPEYPGFVRFPIEDLGLSPADLRVPAGGLFIAKYVYFRTGEAEQMLRELRAAVAEYRAPGETAE